MVVENNNHSKKHRRLMIAVGFVMIAIIVPRVIALFHIPQARNTVESLAGDIGPTPTTSPLVVPSVIGNTFYDINGQPVSLQGETIESLDTIVINKVVSKHMNAILIPFSLVQNSRDYLKTMDAVVHAANKKKLYVILAPTDGMLAKDSLVQLKAIASRYIQEPYVVFDLLYKPKYPNWDIWLHGDGHNIASVEDAIHAIRDAGVMQPIVIELPHTDTLPQAWDKEAEAIKDTNILYAINTPGISNTTVPSWDKEWGALLKKHPLMYTGWQIQNSACQSGASNILEDSMIEFLSYTKSRGISWIADFDQSRCGKAQKVMGDFLMGKVSTDIPLPK